MIWIAKQPPIYVWQDDQWYNESNRCTYKPDFWLGAWIHDTEQPIGFPKKTIKMGWKYG